MSPVVNPVHTQNAVHAPDAVHTPNTPRQRRIREDVRDGVYVMVFSCAASLLTAVGLLALTRLAG